jgi:hypothetical protein
MEKRVASETDSKIIELAQAVEENKEKALSRLLSLVIDVQADLHKNYKI